MDKSKAPAVEDRSKRDQIIEHAFRVFYENGFHSSGMDLLLEGSGISKRTLYKYFASKEDLIGATVNYYHAEALGALNAKMNRGVSPAEKILKAFDLLADNIKSGDYLGCYAVNAKLEYVNKNDEIEQACGEFFDDIEKLFLGLCQEYGSSHAKSTAYQIALLFRGAIVSGQHTKTTAPAMAAKSAVKILLEASQS